CAKNHYGRAIVTTEQRIGISCNAHKDGGAYMRRIVVTGMGAVTCLGYGVDALWDGLIHSKSGISRITRFDPKGLRNEEAGEVKDEVLADAPLPDDAIEESTLFAYLATLEACEDAMLLDLSDSAREQIGLVFSTNFGGASCWEDFATQWLTGQPLIPNMFEQFKFDFATQFIARKFGFRGPTLTLSNSCSSGTSAIGAAFDLIRSGMADIVIADGHDMLSRFALAGLSILRTITAERIRPFDKNRSGTIFGEGAGVLVLEAEEHARRRGARIYAEVKGYALNSNAYHLTAPDKGGCGMIRVLKQALEDARISPQDVDYINAHGTGTPPHDPEETHAIKMVLGQRAYEIPVSSIKAATGHVMAGAGTVEAIATIKAINDGIIPPTLNYETPDPECDLDY
ncbi:MAG TPA: beta-ketoacyl-[acyl-carrier-protein] synthase family protein, partial [Armatimonadetes bacterium]|nr:beta-ketoacyl-[acyl-carrier-protein] synthase family protein [Armatimonadota bacterium]